MADQPESAEDGILAAARVARRQSRINSWSNIIAFGTGIAVAVIGVTSLPGDDAIFGIIAGMIVVFPMKWLAMTVLGRPFGLKASMRPDALTAAPVAAAPRLAWPAISDDDVMTARLTNAFGPSVTNAGPVSARGAPSAGHGVLQSTSAGLVFLPDAGSRFAHKTTEFVKGVAKMVADEVLEGSGTLLGVALDPFDTKPPTAIGVDGAFVAESRTLKTHFCLPWAEIVETAYDKANGVCVFTRQRADGPRQAYGVFDAQSELCLAVFGERLNYEVNRTLMERFVLPKREELLPGLRERFAGIYGDTVGEHEVEILQEGSRQAVAWLDANVDPNPVLIEALRPTLRTCLDHGILPERQTSLLADFALAEVQDREAKAAGEAPRPA